MAGASALVADRPEPLGWETFTAQAAPDAAAVECEGLLWLHARLDSGRSVLRYLMSGQADAPADLFYACLRLLPADQLEIVGRALPDNPPAVSALARLLPDNIWAAEALPNLLRHRAQVAKPSTKGKVGSAHDFLEYAGLHGEYVNALHMINSFARRAVPADKGVCVLATARNEGPYLLEWVAYHLALKADAIFLYSNDNDDGSDQLLHCLSEAGAINWIDNHVNIGVSPQFKAYGHALQFLPEILDYRWTAIIDLDEFITLDHNRFATIPNFIQSLDQRGVDAIALSWVMFGSDGQSRRTEQPLIQRFQKRLADTHQLVKPIFRTNLFIHARCHFPIWDDFTAFKFCNAAGHPHPGERREDVSAFAPKPLDEVAWINHYYNKSAEEFILRRTSSKATALATDPAEEFFWPHVALDFRDRYHDTSLQVDNRILAAVPQFAVEVDRLRSLPGVRDALKAIEIRYAERVGSLARILSAEPRFQAEGSPEKWFLDILHASTRETA